MGLESWGLTSENYPPGGGVGNFGPRDVHETTLTLEQAAPPAYDMCMKYLRHVGSVVTLCLLGLLVGQPGCGSNSGSAFGNDGGGGDGSRDGSPTMDGTLVFDGSQGCGSGCPAGQVCAGGTCCAMASVCGAQCCMGSDVCLFNACVTPGKPCHSANDCGPGQYCEPALGDNGDGGTDGGMGMGPDGSVCTQPLPVGGRCLPLPPLCAGDAGAPDGGCVADCEYHPPAGGPLSATVKWAWGPTAIAHPNATDVWSTPTVGRVYDTNCDGQVNELDSPVVVFISGNVSATCCGCNGATPSTCEDGIIRMLDGSSGREIWTLAKASASSVGFMGSSPALGDVDKDGFIDIVAMTGEGFVVLIDRNGNVTRTSDLPYPHATALNAGQGTGWGGGLAIADMDLDGFPEIAFGDTVWTTTAGTITRRFVGGAGRGGGAAEETSAITDVDGASDGHLELVAGNTAYKADGTTLWTFASLPDGFPGIGDFDKNGTPEVVLVGCPVGSMAPCQGQVWILEGATGQVLAGPVTLPFSSGVNNHGGPPTVADFDGDGLPEIGVAGATYYAVLKPVVTGGALTGTINVLWKMQDHDYSSSVTGSTVFDFEGDGKAEVIYADECWLWVFSGPPDPNNPGKSVVRLAIPHSSFTGTETSMLADIDGDGHAELLVPSNGVDMTQWHCAEHAMGGAGGPVNGQYWTAGPVSNKSYRGLVAYGDSADSWVGTRTLWNEHTYHVTNICDDRDTACAAPNVYGSIPTGETKNWTLPWLNDFRQNVQDKGIFDAPDAVVALAVDCVTPPIAHVSVRNIGLASLPSGVAVGIFDKQPGGDVQVGMTATTYPLYPSQTEALDVTLSSPATDSDTFYAKILIPSMPTFHECRTDNDQSDPVQPMCTR